MLYPLLEDIIIPENRQRKEFEPEAMQELITSIEDHGLMHPIVVRQIPGAKPVLVAGERRLRAMKEIFALGGEFVCDGITYIAQLGKIPALSLGELTELAAEEAELDENLRRRDLTWQELADTHARLHTLRSKQKLEQITAQGSAGTPAPLVMHTVADTAKEIHGRSDGDYQGTVRREIIVARHLDNPAVAKAKSLDEAFKILKKQEVSAKNVELAKAVGATFTSAAHEIHNANCLRWLEGCPGEVFDVILTDPPYGMGADEFGDGGGKLTGIEHHYDDSYESWVALMQPWTKESFRVAKPQAHAYVFCDIDRFHELRNLMATAGWYVHRTPLIVHKQNSGRVPLPDRGPRRQWEMILYAIKGNKPTTHIYPDVIPCVADPNMTHGAQKPIALYTNLLQRSVKPGDKVLDSFGGSGTIIPAAHSFKCYATVIEQEPEYYGMCLRRIEELKKLEQPGLPGLD